jgi:hypothetical protein
MSLPSPVAVDDFVSVIFFVILGIPADVEKALSFLKTSNLSFTL